MVGDEVVSQAERKYFDLSLQRSPSLTSKIRVMTSENHNVSYFRKLMKDQEAVCLQNMSPTKNGKVFFNESSGSSSKREEVSFECGVEVPAKVKSISKDHPDGTFTLVGQIRWTGETREVVSYGKTKSVRHAKFVDESGDINMSIWDNLIENVPVLQTCKFTQIAMSFFKGWNVTTTSNTSIEPLLDDQTKITWERIPLSERKHLCCPEAVAVKVEQHAICRTFECKQKLRLPKEASSKIYCDRCKKALPLQKCRLATTCEVTFEVGFKQYNLTIFNDVVNEFWGKLDREELEDTILNMHEIDVFYDNRRVVQKLQLHDESKEA